MINLLPTSYITWNDKYRYKIYTDIRGPQDPQLTDEILYTVLRYPLEGVMIPPYGRAHTEVGWEPLLSRTSHPYLRLPFHDVIALLRKEEEEAKNRPVD